MTWKTIRFSDVKPHIAPPQLVSPVVDDIDIRFGGTHEIVDLRDGAVYLDFGGAMLASRTYQIVDLDGLELAIPTTEVGLFLRHLRDANARTVNDIEFVKLHTNIFTLVLTPVQRDRLVAIWAALLPTVEAEAVVERTQHAHALRALNAHPNIVATVGQPAPKAVN